MGHGRVSISLSPDKQKPGSFLNQNEPGLHKTKKFNFLEKLNFYLGAIRRMS